MQMDHETRSWLSERADYLAAMLYDAHRGLSDLMDLCGKVLRS